MKKGHSEERSRIVRNLYCNKCALFPAKLPVDSVVHEWIASDASGMPIRKPRRMTDLLVGKVSTSQSVAAQLSSSVGELEEVQSFLQKKVIAETSKIC
jgi:hypothetical protein